QPAGYFGWVVGESFGVLLQRHTANVSHFTGNFLGVIQSTTPNQGHGSGRSVKRTILARVPIYAT
ncbi:MAG: hypothetical protein KGJ09_10315, partial [Candidatus Omnitrophica bacterium]|nr:hypothetical protein [Candidatus Omnitrophota bacterium]